MINNIENLFFTNKEGKEVIANINSISIKQAAINFSFYIHQLKEERILQAANNTWTLQTGKFFLELVKDFKEGRAQLILN